MAESNDNLGATNSIDSLYPEVTVDLMDTDEIHAEAGDTFDNSGNKPVAVLGERKKRNFSGTYQEATTGMRSKAAMVTDAVNVDLFDMADEIDAMRTPLSELQSTTMEQIRNEIKGSNGLKSISTFTGCGGSDTGFAWAGYEPLLSVEFVDAARETLAANYKSHIITPASLIEQAKAIADELGVTIHFEKQRKIRGKQIASSIDWPKTLSGMSGTNQDKFRYAVTMAGLKQSNTRDQMPIFGDDIRGMSPEAVMDFLNLKPGELGVFEGSPPCKSFSTAGSREGGWGHILHYSDERHQTTDDLFLEYLRLLTVFKPRAFIAENVEGLGMGAAEREVLVPLLKAFAELGYVVEAKGVNSKDYGVPQSRPRMFIVGIRKDQVDKDGNTLTPEFPTKFDEVYTVQDALDFASPNNDPDNLANANLDRAIKENGDIYEIGKIWKRLGYGDSPQNKAYSLIRSHPDRPAPTITATSAGNQAAAGVMHPHECRKFTVAEYKALFGFPQDYVFTGTWEQQGERMGRSVPPFLMKQLAESIAKTLSRAVPQD